MRHFVYTSLNKLCFTCDEREIYSIIKKSQNIMNMIVRPKYKRRWKWYLTVVNCWFFSKVKINTNSFRFNDAVTHILTSGVVYKFPCGLCNESYYGESVKHFEVRSSEHIGILPLINLKWVQSRNDSDICHLLLNCDYSPISEHFSDLCHENENYLLELKGSLFVVRDWPSLNWNVAPFYIFEYVLATLFAALFGLSWSVF